jgi:tetratricopeptide (TPR) repeat protein
MSTSCDYFDPALWLLACWRHLAQAAGDTATIETWLEAHPPQVPLGDVIRALPQAARRWLSQPGATPTDAARVMAAFGTVMQQSLVMADAAMQIELAIAAYQLALQGFSPTATPGDWAITLNNLATAYRHRRLGHRADNLERAIALYRQALTGHPPVATRPVSLTGLGEAYDHRLQGDRAENLEQAIAAYEQALATISPSTLPIAWTLVMNKLAAAYGDRLQGDRQENIDRAIHTYQRALG